MVLTNKRYQKITDTGRYLKAEWENVVTVPINEISPRFVTLRTYGRIVVVRPRVKKDKAEDIHLHLTEIDLNFTPNI